MQPVRLGLVGCGVIGQAHLRVAASLFHARFVAVCDIRKEAADRAAAQHAIANVYTDADDLFAAPDIQGVVLALPAHLRTDLALCAFAAGKHVLTEKPVAMNAGDIALSYERGEFMPTQTDEAWQIIGEQGALRLRMTPGVQKQLVHDMVSHHGTLSRVLWEGDEDWGPAHRCPVADFAAAISERRQPLTSLEQALVIQQLTDAIYQAATCGECVEVK